MSSARAAYDTRLGIAGHFALNKEQKAAALESGLSIRQESAFSRTYRISSVFDNVSVEGIIPPGIESEALPDGERRIQRTELKHLLSFLRQPLTESVARAVKDDIDSHAAGTIQNAIGQFKNSESIPSIFLNDIMESEKEYAAGAKARAHSDLVLTHKLMNFLTSGAVNPEKEKPGKNIEEIIASKKQPESEEERNHKAATSDEDHAEIQEQIDFDAQRRATSEMNGIFIRGAVFDPARGLYVIKLDPRLQENTFEGEGQKQLAEKTLSLLSKIKPGWNRGESINLNATELGRFTAGIHDDHEKFHESTEKAAREECVYYALGQTAKRAEALEKDALFSKINAALKNQTPAEKLGNILKSTSALSGFLRAPILGEAWKRYHFTDREESPAAEILKETEVFQAVARHYIARGNVTPAELEAITHEFFPLMMFGARAMQTFGNALQKEDVNDNAKNLELCAALENTFRTASLAQSDLTDRFMPREKHDLLDAFSMYSGEKKFSATAKFGEVLQNYAKDIVNSIKEHPKVTISVIAGITALLHLSAPIPAPVTDTNAVEPFYLELGDIGYGDGTFTDPSQRPQADVQSCHLDLVAADVKNWITTGSPLRKHCIGKSAENMVAFLDLWRAPMRWAMNLTGQPVQDTLSGMGPLFEKSFGETLPKVDNFWLATNIPQDLSHAGYWGWSFGKGAVAGMAGTATLLKLFNPLVDLGYTAKQAATDKLSARDKNKNAAAEINTILQHVESPAFAVETPPGHKEDSSIKISSPWLGKKEIRIGPGSLDDAAFTLARMELAAAHIGISGIATNTPRHAPLKAALKQEIDALGEVLAACRADETPDYSCPPVRERLGKSLSRVMALEVAQTGRSCLHENLVGAPVDAETARKLNRLGHHILNTAERAQLRKEEKELIYWRAPVKAAKGAAITGATYVADGFSHLKNAARLAKESKISGLAFDPLVETGSKLVNFASRPAFAAASMLGAAGTYLDYSGKIQDLPPALQPVAESLAQNTATGAAAAFGTANFLIWNVLVSDLIQVHLATGLACSTAAALFYHYPGKYGIRPLTDYARETLAAAPPVRPGSIQNSLSSAPEKTL